LEERQSAVWFKELIPALHSFGIHMAGGAS